MTRHRVFWTAGRLLPAAVGLCLALLGGGALGGGALGGEEREGRLFKREGNTAESPRYSLKLTNTLMIIDGTVRSDVEQVRGTGTNIDLHRDLGFDQMFLNLEVAFEARLTPRDRLTARFNIMSAEAENNIGKDIHFDHESYEAGSKLDSQLLLRRLGGRYDRLVLERNKWGIWLGLGLDHMHVRARLHDFRNNISDVEDVNSTLDLYGHFEVTYDLRDDVRARLDLTRSIPIDLSDIEHNNLRFELGLEWQVNPTVAVITGFVIDRIDIEDRDEDAPGVNIYELNGDGLILGVRFSF